MKPIMQAAFAVMTMTLFAIAGMAQAGPFGYDAGDEMPPIDDINDGGIPYAEVSPPPPTFDSLTVYGTEKTGICEIRVTRWIPNDSTDIRMTSSINGLEEVLSEKYGEPIAKINKIKPGSLWDNQADFMMSLAQGEREIEILWSIDGNVGDVHSIYLKAFGVDMSNGMIFITYLLSNYDDCSAEARANMGL